MSALSEKLRKAREVRVPAGKHTFIVRRPTDLEYFQLSGEGPGERILPFVIGWEDVTELDLGIAGGDPHPLPFDAEACKEWLSDRPDHFVKIADGIKNAYADHVNALESLQKN